MAPLKAGLLLRLPLLSLWYPWLRGHGSFQADPTIDAHPPRILEQSDHGFPKFVLRLATIHACKPLDALTRQGSAHTPVRDLGHFARSSAFGGERHPHGPQASRAREQRE